ncbi:hypothetical protein LXL04_004781 [Taraxacum kok-saghyz]
MDSVTYTFVRRTTQEDWLYCVFFAYVGSAGLGFLRFCNLNRFRVKFILGFSIFMGFSIPQYFNEYISIKGYGPIHTKARWDVVPIVVVFSAGPVGVSSFSNCCLKQLIRINNPSFVMNVALILWRNNETVCNQGQLWNKVEDDVVSNRLVYWRWVLKWRFHVISLWQQIAVYTLTLILR